MFFNKSRRFQWFHQEMHQNTPQKKGKKRGLPYYLMRQPLFLFRFRPCGLPCWRLAPRKPLFLRRAAPTPVPRSDSVRARLPAKPMNSVYEREPWNGKRRKSSPRSGLVRARLPAKPMNSVYEREPWNGKRRKSSSRSDSVRARLSAKPMNSVYEREPWNGKRRKSSPRSGSVRARQPAKPMNSVFEREPPAMLAPCTPQARAPPSGHANLGAFPGPSGELCEAKNTGIPIHFLERVIGL